MKPVDGRRYGVVGGGEAEIASELGLLGLIVIGLGVGGVVVVHHRRMSNRLSSRQIEESISILNFVPPNRGVDF